jgi:hypothetical protein
MNANLKTRSSEIYLLMQQWGIHKASPTLQRTMRSVLSELSLEAIRDLRRETALQVAIIPSAFYDAWALLPVRPGCRQVNLKTDTRKALRELNLDRKTRRLAIQELQSLPPLVVKLRPATRLLLFIADDELVLYPLNVARARLRQHLGQAMLYLRDPWTKNRCYRAQQEWVRHCK